MACQEPFRRPCVLKAYARAHPKSVLILDSSIRRLGSRPSPGERRPSAGDREALDSVGDWDVAAIFVGEDLFSFLPRHDLQGVRRRAIPVARLGGDASPRFLFEAWDVHRVMSGCIDSYINKLYILRNGDLYDPLSSRLPGEGDAENTTAAYVQKLLVSAGPDGFVKLLPVGKGLQSTTVSNCVSMLVDEDIPKHSVRDVLFLPGQHFVLLNHLGQMNYRELVNRHRSTDADVTLACLPVEEEISCYYSLVKIDKQGRVLNLEEKPGPHRRPFRGSRIIPGTARTRTARTEGDSAIMKEDTTKLGLDEHEAAVFPYIASVGVYVFKEDVLRKLLKTDSCRSLLYESSVLGCAIKDYDVRACDVSHLFAEENVSRWRLLSALDKQVCNMFPCFHCVHFMI
eukprot:jgi/Botrbrau1/14612/Bobra.67_2s0012.1